MVGGGKNSVGLISSTACSGSALVQASSDCSEHNPVEQEVAQPVTRVPIHTSPMKQCRSHVEEPLILGTCGRAS